MLITFYIVLTAVAAVSVWGIERIDRPARRLARQAPQDASSAQSTTF